MTLSKRADYSTAITQKNKITTIEKAKQKVNIACDLLQKTGMFRDVSFYRPDSKKLYIGNAPAIYVDTPKGRKLVIAPDLRCSLLDETYMWVEVKDKPQRFFYPDTGCDAHQYVGFWSVNKYKREPVLMLFTDPPLEEMIGLKGLSQDVRESFIRRWKRFAPDDMPVFYGNWIKILAEFDGKSKYPKCFHERSRDKPMKIIYMDIEKMMPFSKIESLRAFIENRTKARDIGEFAVFDVSSKSIIRDPEDLLQDC